MKTSTAALLGALVCVSALSYRQSLQNDALRTICKLSDDEIRILTYELKEERQKPSYEDGYKSALIKLGGPQQPGDYYSGWDDAQKLFQNESYQTGYHNAISQFGYQKPDTTRYLAPEPEKTQEKDTTAKVGKL